MREISATFGLYSRRVMLVEVLREFSATFGLWEFRASFVKNCLYSRSGYIGGSFEEVRN